jgi:integrase
MDIKIDPYNNEASWLAWKKNNQERILGVSEENSKIILRYLGDMEKGINISLVNKKGARSYIRLNTLKNRITFMVKQLEARERAYDIKELTEEQICGFFTGMRNGEIKKQDGGSYKSVRDYAKVFKAFWHWHQKVSKKQGKEVPDSTVCLDTTGSKPDWVYLTEEQVRKLCDNAKFDYKVLMMFLFDTGIRAPTELINIKVSDLNNNCKELNIREEISKTFGRRIKLMICSGLLKEYIENKKLGPDDYLFSMDPKGTNQYLKRLSKRVFGDAKSPAGQRYSELTMYDFRHISCCYWLPRYKSESALKFRFGWKKSDKIHYYSEMLGMRDTISEEDLLIDITKTDLEKRLIQTENEKDRLKERVQVLESQMAKISEFMNIAKNRVEILADNSLSIGLPQISQFSCPSQQKKSPDNYYSKNCQEAVQ